MPNRKEIDDLVIGCTGKSRNRHRVRMAPVVTQTPAWYAERRATTFEWFVLVGQDCFAEFVIWLKLPDEEVVRRILGIPDNVPILIGRP